MSLFDRLRSHRSEKIQAEKETGKAFLEKNRQQEGVVELPGGIQYTILQQGNGPRPGAESTIRAHYRGCLLNGQEFDSSYKRNQPFTASLRSLIRGWQQVIPLMPVGSTWRIWIPSEGAYGDNGTGGIPGGSTLQFDIELLEIIAP